MKMEFEGTQHFFQHISSLLGQQRRHLKKKWWDCIKGDMESFGLFHKDYQDKDYWRD